ncbi:MAG: putative rane protein [Bacteroidetes bacterium]|nr:putative rane protein [Bacteroidota bacterium]
MKKFNYYILLLIAFVIGYFFMYGPYGYNDADDGYTMALCWRMYNGEIPYRDFILVRPPLPFLVHLPTLYLVPQNYQVIFERFLFFVMMGCSALFAALSIDKLFDLKTFRIHPFLLATIGFVFSVHNFPPMAWCTVDAVFWGSLGIYILVKSPSLLSVTTGMLFLFFAALCKQSFYLMPFAGIIFIHVFHRDRKKTAAAIISLTAMISLFLLVLSSMGALKGFIKMTVGSTTLSDLIAAGVFRYFVITAKYLLVPLAVWLAAVKLSAFPKFARIKELVPYFFISFIVFYLLAKFVYTVLYAGIPYEPEYSPFYQDDTATLLFILSVFLFIANFSMEKKWLGLMFMILLSWSSGISWGYQTTAFFSTPMLFCFFIVANKYFNTHNITRLAVFTLLIGTLTYQLAYEKPYCNPLKRNLTYNLSDILPKLSHIKVGRDTYDKYHELLLLKKKYGDNFKTLPGMPLVNYLTNTNSPVPLDWIFNAEVNNNDASILDALRSKKTLVFMERHPQLIKITDIKEKFHAGTAYFITHNWERIDSTNYFDIYKPKEENGIAQ